VALIVSFAALALVGAYAATVWAVSGSGIAPGTTVAGVDVGGMSVDEAATALSAQLGERAAAPIAVKIGTKNDQVDPTSAGLAVDWAATVADAAKPLWAPQELWRQLTSSTEISPVVTVDQSALTAELQRLAAEVDAEPVEPTITYTEAAAARMTPGSAGITLLVPRSAEAITAAYMQPTSTPVVLPVTTTLPQVSDVEASHVLTSLAEPAVARAVTVKVGEDRITVAPEVVASTLTFAPQSSTLQPTLDAKALRKQLADGLDPLQATPKRAQIVIRDGRPVILRSTNGVVIASDDVASAVMAVLPATTAAQRVAVVKPRTTQASFTTADAKALNITERLSSFRQYFPPAAYRWQNVGRAAAYLNGTILEPGETFSMNNTIHERTRANGYTEGFIIQGGRFREELGGGVSIITTATWTAGFYAGLDRVEQHPHGLYISRYQAGLEATVAWGLLDLKLRNSTGNGVLITATRYSDGVLIEMWGKKKYSKVTASFSGRYNYTGFSTVRDNGAKCVASEGVSGFSISVTRRRYIGSTVASTETFPTTYRATPHVICTNPAASSA
jgi:vancomycin resistance protein YoaR